MSNINVSVIIPIYNAEKYLDECLSSVAGQTYSNFECVMIDDGSKDSSAEIAKSYAARDGRFKYFYQDNAGVSAARNYGIDVCKGEYIVFVDSDDVISPHSVKWLTDMKEKYPDSLPALAWKRFRDGETVADTPPNMNRL